MASYLGLIISTAFVRWAPKTDLASGVLGAIVPCAYVLLGRPVPDNVSLLVAEIAVGVVVGWVAIRLLIAPYLIWKADQATIADLRHQIEDPVRQRRKAFDDGHQKARADFALEMRKYTYGENASFAIHNFTSEVVDHLTSFAALFQHDEAFAAMWRVFSSSLEREVGVTMIEPGRNDPDGFIEIQINRNLGFYYQSRKMAARSIIAYLTYDASYKYDLMFELDKLQAQFQEYGRVDFHSDSSLDAVLANRPQSKVPKGAT